MSKLFAGYGLVLLVITLVLVWVTQTTIDIGYIQRTGLNHEFVTMYVGE